MKKLNRALAFGMAAIALPAAAAEQEISFNTYGDWRASVMQFEGGEETWRECRASTGGDGDPVLAVSMRQYDAGPPEYYPEVRIFEQAPRHYNTMMQQDSRVGYTFDDGESFAAIAQTGIAEGVFQTATAAPPQDVALYVLQGMRRAARLDILVEGRLLLSASLNGFTAAYGKIAEACGFSTVGVITPLPDMTAHLSGEGDPGDDGTLLFEQFGVWRAQAEEYQSEDTFIIDCFASIPTDQDRRLGFGTNSLEATPPASFPPLTLSEAIPETTIPMVARGGLVQFVFDTGLILPGEVMTDTIDEGARFIDVTVKSGYRDLALREMRRATTLWVYGDSRIIYQTPLNGFAETYAAIARACDFTTAGVLD